MQNIFFYGVILGFTKEQMEEKLDDILAFADIGEFIHQPLKTYSSGMKSRLGFAVAVHIDPEILILDEVLAVGDVLFRRKCYAKMEELFKGGKTIIYVSHDANSIKQLCNRAIFLLDGKIVMDSDPKSVTQQYERFLFTKEEDKIKVKQELLNIHEKIEKPSLIKNKQHTSSHIVTQEKALLDENNYLPSLLSSPVYINKKFAILKDISIQNQKNKIVNVLKLKQLYTIKFKAIFPSDAKDVFVGAQILTMQGVLLSGSNTKHYKNEVFTVQKNEVLDVSINFTCLLLPDIYIIKIFAINAEESAFVDDAYIFKVENMPWAQGGNVHLYQDIQVKRYFNE
jgi:lipopolysaccharide transport system ATP-binding protein